jgi:hypothetical protein
MVSVNRWISAIIPSYVIGTLTTCLSDWDYIAISRDGQKQFRLHFVDMPVQSASAKQIIFPHVLVSDGILQTLTHMFSTTN